MAGFRRSSGGSPGDHYADMAAASRRNVLAVLAAGIPAVAGSAQSGPAPIQRGAAEESRAMVSLRDFGASGNGVADETAALFKARDHCAATGRGLIIPQGDYKYRRSPNWAVTDLVVIAQGRVRFFHVGAGDGFVFDAGAKASNICNNVRFCADNRIHLYGSATTRNGVWGRSVHHSHVGVNVHGCGAAHAGLHTQFSVCSVWDVVVSANEGGWHQGNKPGTGYKLDRRLSIETTSYCYFANSIIEGVDIGIHLVSSLGNVFVGGTSEGCSRYGVLVDEGAMWDRFIGMDFEVNGVADIYCSGLGTEFISCDTYDKVFITSAARRCIINGGGHERITIGRGALGCTVTNSVYNRRATGADFSDDGTATEIFNLRNGAPPHTQYLTGSATLGAWSVEPGGTFTVIVAVEGARPGDFFEHSCDAPIGALQSHGHCDTAGRVRIVFRNNTTGKIERAPCTVRVRGMRGV